MTFESAAPIHALNTLRAVSLQDLSFALSHGPVPPPGAPLGRLSRLEALHMLGLQSCQLVSVNGSLQARGGMFVSEALVATAVISCPLLVLLRWGLWHVRGSTLCVTSAPPRRMRAAPTLVQGLHHLHTVNLGGCVLVGTSHA